MFSRWLCIAAVFLIWIAPAWAQTKAPLRFVPSQAEWVVKVDRPRTLVDTIEKHALFQQAQKLAGIREYYDTTSFQQAYQLLAYFEKQLGQDRYEILEDLTAGGVIIAARLTPPKGAVFVMQAKDDVKLRKFLDVAFDVLQKELNRQESKDKLVRSKYEGYDVGKIGSNLTFAIADGALIVGSDEKVLKAALEAQLKKNGILQNANFSKARKQASPNALAWTWLHLAELRKNEDFQNGLNAAALDPFQMVLFGGLSDLLKRAPYLTAALTRDGDDYRLGAYMPVGSDGMAPIKHMILPTDAKSGTLPLLQVPRAISSSSFVLDLGQLWNNRLEILGEKNAQGLDEGEKNIAKILGGIKLSKVLNAMGSNQRLVFAQQKERPYKIKAAAPFPAFALVTEMRDPSFAKDMNSIFRSGALVATFSFGLQLKETTYKNCDLVSYYFSETKKVEGDPGNSRFNFSPTYVTVGNQFVMSATAELARDLVDVLQAEQAQKLSKASMQTRLYSSGLAEIIRSNEDATLTQLILAQALPPKAAKEELRTLLNFIEQLGSLRIETNYGANEFRFDVLWQAKKK
ncbi:MAG: hypothetical protein EXR98_03330 [Gemmataceae bacterium]|nr:hypothetical protein [Gemmataceae bacterium]